jgi:hypothetical protein
VAIEAWGESWQRSTLTSAQLGKGHVKCQVASQVQQNGAAGEQVQLLARQDTSWSWNKWQCSELEASRTKCWARPGQQRDCSLRRCRHPHPAQRRAELTGRLRPKLLQQDPGQSTVGEKLRQTPLALLIRRGRGDRARGRSAAALGSEADCLGRGVCTVGKAETWHIPTSSKNSLLRSHCARRAIGKACPAI